YREVGIRMSGGNEVGVGVGGRVVDRGAYDGFVRVVQARVDRAVTHRVVGHRTFPAADGVGAEQQGVGGALGESGATEHVHGVGDVEVARGKEGETFLRCTGPGLGVVPLQYLVDRGAGRILVVDGIHLRVGLAVDDATVLAFGDGVAGEEDAAVRVEVEAGAQRAIRTDREGHKPGEGIHAFGVQGTYC